MGKLLQGILGGIKGKVGNIVGSSWKGIPVVKAKPLSVANPQTAAQVAQRSRMTNIVAYLAPAVANFVKPLWDRFAVKMSGYNAFIKTNIDLFDSENPSPAANLVASTGKMASTAISSVQASDGDFDITVFWEDDSGQGLKLATDLAYILARNRTKGETFAGGGTKTRATGSAKIDNILGNSTGDVIDVYLAFKRADGTVVSESYYTLAAVSA